jgi:excisionase family DNA binding protein
MKVVLSVKEVARSQGVSLKWVYDLLAAGRLRGARKIGRVWRIPAVSVRQRRRRHSTRESI